MYDFYNPQNDEIADTFGYESVSDATEIYFMYFGSELLPHILHYMNRGNIPICSASLESKYENFMSYKELLECRWIKIEYCSGV